MYELLQSIIFPAITGSIIFCVLLFLAALFLRVVVSTNDVHIVQSKSKTVSYGKDQAAGNVYYAWPSWVPVIGIKVTQLPVSVFPVELNAYSAYDKNRLPFKIHILAFFRVDDPNTAAQRVHTFKELEDQLHGILQGASRSILATSQLDEILEKRAEYGVAFTTATDTQLKSWGVVNVKNIELMDIQDDEGSKVIQNIMAKRKSHIEMESRTEVAKNMQAAQTAEIEAQRQVLITQQQAEEQVGIRTAQKEQQVGISNQQAQQQIKEQERITAEKQMAVVQVNQVKQAEIEREVFVVKAEQDKQTAIIKAEGDKQQTITVAQGTLEQAKLHAQGIEAEGKAKGVAEQAVLMAPVNSQIELAKEIGSNQGYQTYLVSIRQIEANQQVGIEQAKSLQQADVKVFANAGTPPDGLNSISQMISPKGGLQLGAMMEAFKATDVGAEVVKTVTAAITPKNGSRA
jgi:flotillin